MTRRDDKQPNLEVIEARRDGESFWAAYSSFLFLSPDRSQRVKAEYVGEPPHGDSYHQLIVNERKLPGFAWGGSFAWSADSRYFCCAWMEKRFERKTIVIDVMQGRYFVLPTYFNDFQITWPEIIETALEPKFAKHQRRRFVFTGDEVWTAF